ncbi:testis-expressed protein 13C-1-like [Lutra lutra]|uniref:testis-expressed protein 13C-1-like n=1 Tax=Lutra lutra TaxID=9657 RepID=UPI001FD4AEAF|nr:testis-expressed protein 13C-1-like [Lutra lutra]
MREVVDFINKQILRNGVSPHFDSMQLCKSWSDMEKKLRDVLTNSAVAEATKEACAWKTLAQAVRMAQRQKREHAEKVKKLQDQLDEQKLFTNVLVGTVNRLRDMQEREKKAAQLQLQESLTALRGLEEERNLLRNELLRASSAQSQKHDGAVENKKGKEVWTFGAAAEAAAVPAGNNSRSTWKGKHCPSKKFLSKRLKQESGFSCSARQAVRGKGGDWDCQKCHSVNFSWRKKCFKCKNFQDAREGEGSAHK